MKNLLLFSIEDLNDWIEPLGGHPQAYTPNLKRLAAMGMVFESAYTAAPACSPSRTATLFSRFPWETGVVSNERQWFNFFPYGKSKSLIGKLKDGGFETLGAGKVFHSKGGASTLDLSDWSEFHFEAKVNYPPISAATRSGDFNRQGDFGIDPTGEPSSDDRNTDWMIEQIQPDATGKVWALGTFRPHLPFIAPKEFFDLIPENVSLPPGLGANSFDPDNTRSHEKLPKPAKRLAQYQSKPGEVLQQHGEYNAFLRAYLASIAYADSKLGQVLDRLEACNLLKDTLIVLWSDHGWQLGEKLAFRKFTLWERALRVPLIMAGPGVPKGRIGEPVSLVDVAPTILSLLDQPPTEEFSGQDLAPLIRGEGGLVRPYAPSIWGIGFKNDNARFAFSVRTKRYRFTRYWNGDCELYDHDVDPFEHDNLFKSDDPAERERAKTLYWELDKYVTEFEFTREDLPEPVLLDRDGDEADDDD